ncbi:hypothetical protein ANN_09702 [Periplaneta americana]|uniref:HAT C-terminal dimerisation domain-containing protein n=1 Tax=Periplaneta americana TaxID=6978 RepID=A0ABQ8TQ10_PERAM|nr:hypothetical protein ANN_09702 [Periplaneta americana]
MTLLCTLLKSGSDVLIQTFAVLVYRPSFLAMFATTHVCEKLFSTMKIVKTKFRSRLTDKYLRDQLRLAGKGQLIVDMLNKSSDFSRKLTLFEKLSFSEIR